MNAAIDTCTRTRPLRIKEAFSIFDSAINNKSLIRIIPNVFTFGALMAVCARGQNVDQVMKLSNNVEHNYHISPNSVVYSTAKFRS